MGKKKSYSPFRMWGSYVGAIVLLILSIIAVTGSGDKVFGIDEMKFLNPFVSLDLVFQIICNNGCGEEGMFFLITTPLSFMIYGFLLGWGIHSLIRKVRS